MPYVDEGQPKAKKSLPPIVPFVAIIAAAGVSVGLYWVFYENLGFNQWLAPLVTGPLIGCAMRFTGGSALPKAGTLAVVSTLVTCLVAYVLRHILWIKWVDPNFQPTVGHAFEFLFSADLLAILLMAMSAYLAFAIAGVSYSLPTQTNQDA